MRVPELLRAGLSHCIEPEQAAAIKRRPGRIVRVSVRGGHVARTGARAGHVTVWAAVSLSLHEVEAHRFRLRGPADARDRPPGP